LESLSSDRSGEEDMVGKTGGGRYREIRLFRPEYRNESLKGILKSLVM